MNSRAQRPASRDHSSPGSPVASAASHSVSARCASSRPPRRPCSPAIRSVNGRAAVATAPSQARSVLRRVAGLQHGRQAVQPARGANAAQCQPLQGTHPAAKLGALQAARGQRMLERRQQLHRRGIGRGQLCRQQQEAAGWRLVQGHAGAVVDPHTPTQQLGRHPPPEAAAGGDQRRAFAGRLQRPAQPQGYADGLGGRVGCCVQLDARGAGSQLRPLVTPGIGRLGRAEGLRPQRHARGRAHRRRVPRQDGIPVHADQRQEPLEPKLRMARADLFPGRSRRAPGPARAGRPDRRAARR